MMNLSRTYFINKKKKIVKDFKLGNSGLVLNKNRNPNFHSL